MLLLEVPSNNYIHRVCACVWRGVASQLLLYCGHKLASSMLYIYIYTHINTHTGVQPI